MRDKRHPTTFIERLLGSPRIRSGYASLIAHVAVLIMLALAMIPVDIRARPRPIVIVLADAAEDNTNPGSSSGDGLPEQAIVEIAAHAPAAVDPIIPEPIPVPIEPVPPPPV